MKTLFLALVFFLASCITSNDNSTLAAEAYISSGLDTLSISGNSFVWRNCPSDYSAKKNISGTWKNTTEEHTPSIPTDNFWTFFVTTPTQYQFTVVITMYTGCFYMYRDSSEVSIAYIKLE